MNINELTFEVRDESLNRVGQLLPTDLVGWKSVLRFNNVGSWEITLPADHVLGLVLAAPGAGIIVTHLTAGVILSGPTTAVENVSEAGDPHGVMKISGVDDSVILGERLAYPTPSSADVTAQTSAYDTVSSEIASTAMYGYIERNLVAGVAPSARAIPSLVLAADTAIGTNVTKSARFDILGELLTELAVVDGLGFDIKQNDLELEFSVFAPVDRTGEIRMDVQNNTLASTSYGYGVMGLSRAIVAGQGEGSDRTFVEVDTSESLAAETLWGRRIETFIDQRNTAVTAELTQAGLEALAESGATVTSIDVVPSSDSTMRYGIDWNLGDSVTVVVGGQEVSAVVTQVALSVESDGVRVGATVGQPTGVDYDALVAKKQTTTSKRVNALERKESGSGGAATVSVNVGSTTTGAAGSSASVSNSGSSTAVVLDFTIPRGATGAPGAAGSAATVSVGTTTTGAAGSSASVTNSGTSSAAVFDFTIPQGAGVPSGGSIGQTLIKNSSTNYDVAWGTQYVSPNYIINGGMDIWQRGTSGTFASGQYSVADRWICGSSSTTISRDTDAPTGFRYSLKIVAGSANSIYTRLEASNSAQLAGKAVTLSFYYKRTAGTGNVDARFYYPSAADNFSSTTQIGSTVVLSASPSSSWTRYTTTVTMPSNVVNGLQVLINNDGNTTSFIAGVQLEEGSTTTPFRRNGNSIQGELAACQRYYVVIASGNGQMVTNVMVYNTTSLYGVLSFPVPMRTAPTADHKTGTNFYQLEANSNSWFYSAVNATLFSGTNSVGVGITGASGLSAGQAAWLRTAAAGAYVAFSAEL